MQDREENFYMIGSMGLASSIGRCGPGSTRTPYRHRGWRWQRIDVHGNPCNDRRRQTENLVHLCIDNEVYESTGKQRSLSNEIALEKVAAANGYPTASASTMQMI